MKVITQLIEITTEVFHLELSLPPHNLGVTTLSVFLFMKYFKVFKRDKMDQVVTLDLFADPGVACGPWSCWTLAWEDVHG